MAYTLLVWDNVCCFLSASQEELAVKQILKVAAKSERSGMRNVCPSHEQRIRHAQFWYKHHATKMSTAQLCMCFCQEQRHRY